MGQETAIKAGLAGVLRLVDSGHMGQVANGTGRRYARGTGRHLVAGTMTSRKPVRLY